MPLIWEIKDPATGQWKEFSQTIPGDPPASISHWNAFGGREIYLLVCETDDSMSALLQSMRGVDADYTGSIRTVDSDAMEIVQEIHDGQSYERKFFPDKSLVPRDLRFRHVTIKFGLRKCLICGEEHPTPVIGQHTLSHGMDELQNWPGGLRGLMKFYSRSISASVAKAEGFPRVQEKLRSSLELIEEMQKRINADLN